MHIVTLITDFGNKGYRSAALKGSLLSSNAQLNIVDISHEITPFDIDEAAFILRSTYAQFPKNTIHIVSVYNYYEEVNRVIFFKHNDQYFLGPDNGIFSLVFTELDVDVYQLKDSSKDLHYTQICAQVVSCISQQKQLSEIGDVFPELKRKLILQPVTAKNEVRGSVIFIDRYGNITVNIKKQLFEQVRSGRSFSLFFNRHEHIHQISDHYMEVDIGSPLCSFNSQGFLEISVNLQRANELLQIKKGDVIQIKFQD